MPIEISEHARRQLKNRNIQQKLIINAVENPETIKSSFKSRKLRQIHIDDKILEVVTKTEGSRIIVITAYYLEVKL